jgi:hypothetical protein
MPSRKVFSGVNSILFPQECSKAGFSIVFARLRQDGEKAP